MRGLLWVVVVGCTPRPPPSGEDDPGPFHDGSPVITSVAWGCDPDAAAWEFTIQTEGWTGGGALWMAREAETSERHKIYSASAAADGSTDTLKLNLEVVADWRDASSGSSTRWQCADEDDISYLLTVLTPRGDTTADCRTWGVEPAVFAEVEGAVVCETLLAEDSG